MSYNMIIHPSDFAPYQYSGTVHPRSIYDFTYENRYVVYHYTRSFHNSIEYVYECLDTSTRRKTQMFVRRNDLSCEEYSSILSAVLFSTQYNSNRRYSACLAE